ncbi:hypothetical protein HELRODRAFT_162484 [Helobdella robusta]|uniref:Uncharacterized protein n=1 Tax=Helobdella robusta TaxID=6412 RepID=T1ESQ4_HELRO|nr:hypothetical protein HELRODRAFT_162484 [Helobdella robusta]ESN99007.1 hypothetical protein HELRODRAFT_162484 [Helobdella robusta]
MCPLKVWKVLVINMEMQTCKDLELALELFAEIIYVTCAFCALFCVFMKKDAHNNLQENGSLAFALKCNKIFNDVINDFSCSEHAFYITLHTVCLDNKETDNEGGQIMAVQSVESHHLQSHVCGSAFLSMIRQISV